MSLPGRAIIDLAGLEPSAEEMRRLMHPSVAGVIFFARNYDNPVQLRRLVSQLGGMRPSLLFCVDHEGGRVQRFRDGFSEIPPMKKIGALWDTDPAAAVAAATAAGFVIAAELSDCGFDFSFAPVLDLDYGVSEVIGDRAFHRDPSAVGKLAAAFIMGLAGGGMASVGKHFPGHGYARADSHLAVPMDDRPVGTILAEDVLPYRSAIQAGLAAVMPAHVVYSDADQLAAGFSQFWLGEVLRKRLRFEGLVVSDDLSMEGASGAGNPPDRARAALAAGCDIVLLCNDSPGQEALLDALGGMEGPEQARIDRMRGSRTGQPLRSERYRETATLLGTIE